MIVRKMKSKKNIFSIVISIIMIAILVVVIILVRKPFMPKYDGFIIVEVVNLENENIKTKEIQYKAGDKLRDLISNNFDNFTVRESEYGAYVNSIETIEQDDNLRIYIALFVDGEYATSGLDTLEYSNGMIITFKEETW